MILHCKKKIKFFVSFMPLITKIKLFPLRIFLTSEIQINNTTSENMDFYFSLFIPQHLCRGVYSFRLSVRLFVHSYVRHIHGIYDKVFHRVAWKFLKWDISQEPLIRKHSYLDHRYPGGSAFIPWLLTPGSMPQGRARGQNLGHL